MLCKCTDAICNVYQPQQLVCAVGLDDASSWLVQACLDSQKTRRLASACGGAAGRFMRSIFTRGRPKWCTCSPSMIFLGVPVSAFGQVCRQLMPLALWTNYSFLQKLHAFCGSCHMQHHLSGEAWAREVPS